MNLLCLIPVVLLLAIPALAQQNADPAGSSKPAVNKPDAPQSEMRVECSPASRAADLIGRHGCVAGRVFRVSTGRGGNIHISLCPAHSSCTFKAVVRSHDRDKVGDLTYLRGRFIAIMGDVTDFRGHPQIAIKRRQQIRVTAGDPPTQFDADQSKPGINPQSPRGSRHNRAW